MTQRFGDRGTFAVEVGRIVSPALRVVDLWAGGKRLTTRDNVAFLPHLRLAMRADAERVARRDVSPCPFAGSPPEEIYRRLHADDDTEWRERYWFLQWGETVDDLSSYAYLDGGDELVIVFEFWHGERGEIFAARVKADDFATTVREAADWLV